MQEWKVEKIPFLAQGMLGFFKGKWEGICFLFIHVHFVKNEAKALSDFREKLVSSITSFPLKKSVHPSEGRSDFSSLIFFVVHLFEPTLKIPY